VFVQVEAYHTRKGSSPREVEMDRVEGARTFGVAGATYDSFMGRYSNALAPVFADAAHVTAGQSAIDVGCGPGALTRVLVDRLGSDAVCACDPAPGFVSDCAARHPGVFVVAGRAESIPFEADRFDVALAQLVLHFVSEPDRAAREMARTVQPGGTVAACVWDFEDGMQMLRAFWDAALAIDPAAPDEARTMRFGRPGEIAELFVAAGIRNVEESTLRVSSTYDSFDELWQGFLAGVGPAGSYCLGLDEAERERLRMELFNRVGAPASGLTLRAVARCAVGRVP
jgi:SAM-dependent methyltransferase